MDSKDYISFTLFVGCIGFLCFFILKYIVQVLRRNIDEDYQDVKRKEKQQILGDSRTTHQIGGKQSTKKKPKTTWSSRNDNKQSFSHLWLLTSLKGHSGQILDMDLSANGKYLVSCADEDPLDPGGQQQLQDRQPQNSPLSVSSTMTVHDDTTSSSSSSSIKSTSSDSDPGSSRPPSADPSPRSTGKSLSRRQRKNRRREDNSPPVEIPPHINAKKKTKVRATIPTKSVTTNLLNGDQLQPPKNKVFVLNYEPLRQFTKLNISERVLGTYLRSYLLSPEQMLALGYPIESCEYPGRAVIFKSEIIPRQRVQFDITHSRFDVNAREFIPRRSNLYDSGDSSSGHGSGNTSDSEDVSSDQQNDFTDCESATLTNGFETKCVRCKQNFYLSDKEYLTQERCCYHWGKLLRLEKTLYECCKGRENSKGCVTGKVHVWTGLSPGFNGPFDQYVRTKPRKSPPSDGNFGIYALDCEMCYTVSGLELAKITVLGADGRLVYDSFVMPNNEIVDYNTRFSGITARDFNKKSGISAKPRREVQNDLMGFISADTILVGHGLENDLRALRIMHGTVVDTAVTFPHFYGLPYRRSLKSLAVSILRKEIQSNGHNAHEDAKAAMELILWRVRKDFGSILGCQEVRY